MDWRYADAKRMAHARARVMQRTHRPEVELEEDGHTARVSE